MSKTENWVQKKYFKVYYDANNYFIVYINKKEQNNYFAYGEEPMTHFKFEYHEGSVAMDERSYVRLKEAEYEQIDCDVLASSIDEFAEYLEGESKAKEIEAYFLEKSNKIRNDRKDATRKIEEQKNKVRNLNNKIDSLIKKF